MSFRRSCPRFATGRGNADGEPLEGDDTIPRSRSTGSGGDGRPASGPAWYVAAFGKHPGWNDHIDDLGLETPFLIEVKRRLYVEGIGGSVDSGAWDKLESTQRLEEFNHAFVWRRPGDIVIGRMWSSRDGKGRTRYPMIVCMEGRGVPLGWMLERAVPTLDRLQLECQSTTEASAVRSAIDAARSAMRAQLVSSPPVGPELTVSNAAIAQLAGRSEMGPEARGVHRLLYQMERELGDYRPVSRDASRTRAVDVHPQHIRVPTTVDGVGAIATLWLRTVLSQVAPRTEVVLLIPLGQDWLDLVVGTPDGPQFFCLRASPKAVPLVTDIPYSLDTEFVARANRLIGDGAAAVERPIELGGDGAATSNKGLFERLAAWTRARIQMITGIVAALALVGAGAYLFMQGSGGGGPPQSIARPAPPRTAASDPGSPDAETEPWRELVARHRRWFGAFLRRLDEPPSVALPGIEVASRRELYESDASLRGLLGALDAARALGPIDPLGIAGINRADLMTLEQNPPPAVYSGSAGAQIARALDVVRGFRTAFTGEWAALSELRARADAFATQRWDDASALLRQTADGVAPAEGRDVASAVDAAVVVLWTSGELERHWTAIQARGPLFRDTGDRVLGSYVNWAAGSIANASSPGLSGLLSMHAAAARADQLGDRLTSFVREEWETIDHEAFARSPIHAAFNGTPTWETFETWLFEAPDFRSLDPALNPTRTWSVPQRFAEIDQVLESLTREFGVSVDAAVEARLVEVRERAVAIGRRPWNRENQERIAAETAAVQREADELWQIVSARLDRSRAERVSNAAEARARLRDKVRVVAGSSALNSAWARWRDHLLAEATDANVAEVLARADELEGVLTEFQRRLPGSLEGPASPETWYRALVSNADLGREQRIERALSTWKERPPSGPELTRALEAVAIEHVAWLRGAASLSATLASIESRLAGAYGIDEPGPDGTTLEMLAAECRSSVVLADGAIREAAASVLDRVDALRAIRDERRRQALVEEAERGTSKARVVNAWRSLGAGEMSWPGSLEELLIERRLGDAARRAAATVSNEGRARALRMEIEGESRVRWERGFARLVEPAQVESAAEIMDEFGVHPRDLSDKRLAYNALLAGLKVVCGRGISDEDAARRIDSFLGDLKASGVDPQEAATLTAELRPLIADPPPARPMIEVTSLGPGRAGWLGVVEDGRVTFVSNALGWPVSISFVRIESGAGVAEPFYLATTELSVGMLAAATADPDRLGGFSQLRPVVDPPGPHGWEIAQGRVQARAAWASKLPGGTDERNYPTLAAAPSPGWNHPAQYLSPSAALYVCAVLGSRPPTSAEWRAAYEADGWSSGRNARNLRDLRWRRLHEEASAVRLAGKPPYWPDTGVFWPVGFDRLSHSGAAATVAVAADDGYLWFAPVDEGEGVFRHLVGNVAELVFNDAAGASSLAAGDADASHLLAVSKWREFRVLGGSALSAPGLGLDSDLQVDEFDVADQLGYSDVGIRLAFSARGSEPPRVPLGVRVVRIIERHGYLPPD